jgi:hypothetical protein
MPLVIIAPTNVEPASDLREAENINANQQQIEPFYTPRAKRWDRFGGGPRPPDELTSTGLERHSRAVKFALRGGRCTVNLLIETASKFVTADEAYRINEGQKMEKCKRIYGAGVMATSLLFAGSCVFAGRGS